MQILPSAQNRAGEADPVFAYVENAVMRASVVGASETSGIVQSKQMLAAIVKSLVRIVRVAEKRNVGSARMRLCGDPAKSALYTVAVPVTGKYAASSQGDRLFLSRGLIKREKIAVSRDRNNRHRLRKRRARKLKISQTVSEEEKKLGVGMERGDTGYRGGVAVRV